MRIAIPNLGPAIDLPIGTHGYTISVYAAEAGIPCFYTVQPHIITGIDSIQYLALTTHAENWVKWVYHNGKTSLLVYEVYTALHTKV